METRTRPSLLRPPQLGWGLMLLALMGNHACGESKCEDTASCGTFTPNEGCGWRLPNGDIAWTVEELEALGATWTETDGWTLANGDQPEYLCDLPMTDGGTSGTAGSTSAQDSGNSSGTGGASGAAGDAGSGNAGSGGTAGTESDGGALCSNCSAPTAQCNPEGDCVACTDNTHCLTELAPRCDITAYSCSSCLNPTDCARFTAAPQCDSVTGACVECALNTDCTSETASLCGAAHTCEPCSIDDDCSHLTGKTVCDNGACVECTGTNYDACGTLDDVPLVCDSLNNTCLTSSDENKEHSQNVCQECLSDAQCQVGQRCVMQQYDSQNVDHFCFWEQGAGGAAPDDCFAEGRPFVDVLDQQISIDGVESTICGLRVTTCVSYQEYSSKNCAPTGTPNDALCGFNGGDDGYCRLVSGVNYRCTMKCSSPEDCETGVDCPPATPKVCDL